LINPGCINDGLLYLWLPGYDDGAQEPEINKKKAYRLMKEDQLLCGKRIKMQCKRTFVKFMRIDAKRPMEYLCLGIKYVCMQGEGRWYCQLAIMNVFSRKIISWLLQRSTRQTDVVRLMRSLDLRFGLKGVIIRNDNGSQFIAHQLRQVLQALDRSLHMSPRRKKMPTSKHSTPSSSTNSWIALPFGLLRR
jgi:transposase InsO family protein